MIGCSTLPVARFDEHLRSAFDTVRSATLYAFLEPGFRIGCIAFQMNRQPRYAA